MKSSYFKKFLQILLLLFLFVIIIFAKKIQWFFFEPIIPIHEKTINIIFAKGEAGHSLIKKLQKKNLIKYPNFFLAVIRLTCYQYHLIAGEYLIKPGITTPASLIYKIINGKMIYHHFTIIEGWTFEQVITALNKNEYIIHKLNNIPKNKIMDEIGYANEHPEGKFAPDTYIFSGLISDIDVLKMAYKSMQKTLKILWDKRERNLIYKSPYETLIVASLIEKETAIKSEKFLISGVILNRLSKNMRLQIDPTVIYGIRKIFSGKLRKIDLVKNTPYNTYRHKGLPPTPISMPSKESIIAALHPVYSEYLYYLSKGNGFHQFSTSLIQQNIAIKKYLLHNK